MNLETLKQFAKEKDIKELKKIISDSMLLYIAENFPHFPVKGFYRARKHNNVKGIINGDNHLNQFKFEKEFWNAPPQNAKLGRCNDEGESILYSSNRFITALLEVKPEEGDFVTMANFKGLLLFNSEPRLRIQPVGCRYLAQIDDLKKSFQSYKPQLQQKYLDDILDDLFHQDEGDLSLNYKLSVAVSKIYFTGTLNNSGGNLMKTDGLIYSSIIRDKKSFCYALRPESCKKYFRITNLQTFQVIRLSDSFVEVQLLREAKFVNDRVAYSDYNIIFWKDVYLESEKILYESY